MKLYRQGKLWRFLQANPGVRMPAICEAHPYIAGDTIRKAINRMVAAGYARQEGNTRTMRYWSVGDMPPEDLRGKCGRSYVGRSQCPNKRRVVYARNLHPLQAAMGYGV